MKTDKAHCCSTTLDYFRRTRVRIVSNVPNTYPPPPLNLVKIHHGTLWKPVNENRIIENDIEYDYEYEYEKTTSVRSGTGNHNSQRHLFSEPFDVGLWLILTDQEFYGYKCRSILVEY